LGSTFVVIRCSKLFRSCAGLVKQVKNKAEKTAANASRPGKFLCIVAPPSGARAHLPLFQSYLVYLDASNCDPRELMPARCVLSLNG
jgi:hypothetical protein